MRSQCIGESYCWQGSSTYYEERNDHNNFGVCLVREEVMSHESCHIRVGYPG